MIFNLHYIDITIIAGYLAISLFIGFYFRGKASQTLSDYFLGGRSLPWYIAGISMVATTFAADTPLWVAERVREGGISNNWIWWSMLSGSIFTTFFFARLWRRAEILTEPEFLELRYGGKPAAILRGFKAVYLGLFFNAIIIGWVNLALMNIIKVFFGIEGVMLLVVCSGFLFITLIYSLLSGMYGVAFTDAIQFVLAMTGTIVMSIFVVNQPEIGSIAGMKAQLPKEALSFFPVISSDIGVAEGGKIMVISLSAFLSFVAIQWWASWYPGAEPGGGGYIAQRMMSAKDEKNAFYASLFFNVAHYCLRPWSWIIISLGAVIIYPNLDASNAAEGFLYPIRDLLPVGLKGLLLAAFLAAYMSTISTQLNWGAGYLTNDFAVRFFIKNKSQKTMVNIGRISTFAIAIVSILVTSQMKTINQAAEFLIQCGAGMGLVLILRWFWWRINAWSEIAATFTPLIVYSILTLINIEGQTRFLITVLTTTIVWLVVTFITKPESEELLQNFIHRIKPSGWWKGFDNKQQNIEARWLLLAWLIAVIFTYSLLFCIGYLIFQETKYFIVSGLISLTFGVVLIGLIKNKIA
jgi:Na+/proline symporter